MQFQQLSQVLHHSDVLIHESQVELEEAGLSAGHSFLCLPTVGRQMQVVAEGVEECLGAELGEHALDVQVVCASSLDLGTMVGQAGYQCSPVQGAAKGLAVQVQDARIATVTAQGMEGTHTGRGGHSEKDRPRSEKVRVGKVEADT